MSRSQLLDKDEKLEKALEDVEAIEPDFQSALLNAADSDADHEIEYAKAFLKAEGTEKARSASATLACEKFLRERNKNRAIRDFLKEKLRDAQSAVSARQSLLRADVRTNERF